MDSFDIDINNIAHNLGQARAACGKSLKSCAVALGISTARYKKYEDGDLIPTLPELETISFYLQIPFTSLLTDNASKTTPPSQNVETDNLNHLLQIRNSVIGTLLQIEREKKGATYKEISEQCEIPIARLKRYESGLQGIPLSELLKIARVLSIDPAIFFDENSPVSIWQEQQNRITAFKQLPDDIKDFIAEPSNRPYLVLAQNLKTMSTADLTTLAEAIRVILANQPTSPSSSNTEEME
ncbi:MAG: helix-turn-helix domain-containing protein [Chloroflexi bacterium]|jgi:transcriptional regulator with XRE-family HTH domain|nr:helix-turn-helix domain-containing protein [Chloroflexota bacterium]